jgi:sulfur carrier protein
MKLVVNGDPIEVAEAMTVRGLVEHLELGAGPVAVERNGEVVPRARHAETELADGDCIEIVHFVGGG